jgi:unsaturated rhamnogalacturonyl hydrolase
MYFSLFIIFIILLILAIDYFPQFYTWQSRIHIGRITDDALWLKKVRTISEKWLIKTPIIKLTDNTRLIFIDMLRGNYKRNAIQHWQQAALILGLNQLYSTTNDTKIKDKIETFKNQIFSSSGMWNQQPKEIDVVILAYSFINCDFIEQIKYKKSYDLVYDIILNLKGNDGTIAYRKHVEEYRFVDTIGFICPFLIQYGTKFNIPEAVNLGLLQLSEFNNYALFPDTFLPCHTYLQESKKPVGLFGWGRGLGWYAIGLIDSWTALPNDHKDKKMLTQNVINFAKTALQYQNTDGSFNWLVTQYDARKDSSTTATLAWFFANAMNIEELSNECKLATDNALNYLKSVTRRNGSIDFSQGDTKGIAIHSTEFDILPFTQGFCLRTLSLKS